MTILENSRVLSGARPRHSFNLPHLLAPLNAPHIKQNTYVDEQTNRWGVILRPRYLDAQKNVYLPAQRSQRVRNVQ
eukprot:TRINITY_DN1442_c0_g1_i1.p2 TRINITY_DN1442_c0_g1~~TRINITY_DN1442_c0_g1_i1.p2  ORF type:complete len:76 (+),score=1.45 TRINITY_DN1442_c0_g1_i1:83-310(+)